MWKGVGVSWRYCFKLPSDGYVAGLRQVEAGIAENMFLA